MSILHRILSSGFGGSSFKDSDLLFGQVHKSTESFHDLDATFELKLVAAQDSRSLDSA